MITIPKRATLAAAEAVLIISFERVKLLVVESSPRPRRAEVRNRGIAAAEYSP
jgi:hypothetical protein